MPSAVGDTRVAKEPSRNSELVLDAWEDNQPIGFTIYGSPHRMRRVLSRRTPGSPGLPAVWIGRHDFENYYPLGYDRFASILT
ncbi:jg17404 [Pararge aegeria aegeria]|uniref:Jg17404 protein n=1 Tax=Pararge aegeria aegeria TaxID=348720 RepID=A0A8S4R0M1_9NEOP|nr:jg17404 [Pararge aegeria aegeria]